MRLLFLVCGCFPGWLGVTFIERGFVGGQQLALTPSAWEESAVEALKSHASQLFGCSMLGADKRGGLWHVNGCGDGLFVEVTRFKTSAGSELVHDSTHFFFDLASEDPAAAFAEMQRLAPEGQWQVQGPRRRPMSCPRWRGGGREQRGCATAAAARALPSGITS